MSPSPKPQTLFSLSLRLVNSTEEKCAHDTKRTPRGQNGDGGERGAKVASVAHFIRCQVQRVLGLRTKVICTF